MARDPKSNYYDAGGIEVMDVIKAKLTPEQFEGYCLGNIIKYSLRANHKGCKQRDIEKIGQYQRELDRHVAPADVIGKTGSQFAALEPSPIEAISLAGQHAMPVLTIPPIESWNWEALSKHEFTTKAAKDQETFWNSVHPDYKSYGGL